MLLVLLALGLAACGTQSYIPRSLDNADFLQRGLSQNDGPVRVGAAVPDAEETLQLTGLDLYDQGIQPVWLRVENTGTEPLRIALSSIDREYFSPIEVAYMNRGAYSSKGYTAMERWFHEHGLERTVPPGQSREGFVFTHRMPGTKAFNLDIYGNQQAYNFTFFLPLPGFAADYTEVDFTTLYAPDSIRQLDRSSLRHWLENELSCCATGPEGVGDGGPLNVALVASPLALRRALFRGGWWESRADDPTTRRAREHHYRGRPPDAIFTLNRMDSNERLQLHLWLAPLTVEGEPGWVGQVLYRRVRSGLEALSGLENYLDSGWRLRLFARESVESDVDNAHRYLVQNLWYNQSLRSIGFLGGAGESSSEAPRTTFDGFPYVTEGFRAVMFLSEQPVAMSETTLIYQSSRRRELLQGDPVPPPNDRLHRLQQGNLTITSAVPSAREAKAIFGVDLYRRNIQPVWLKVESSSDRDLVLTPYGLDPAYFSPRESAQRLRGNAVDDSSVSSTAFEKRAINHLQLPPHSSHSGYIFTRVDEGTKSFNVDVVGDGEPYLMTFVVPVPGLKLDHYSRDFAGLYPAEELQDVDLPGLAAALDQLPCCVRDASDKDDGDPLNLVLVGGIDDLYYAFLRAGWDETETIYATSLWKTGLSALSGGRYRYSPVSALYVFGRAQDAAFQRARSSIHERNHFRIWLTPLRVEGKPVWIGQISRDIGVHFTWRTITTHKIDPDVDETREYLLENLAYAQAVKRFGYVEGVGRADYGEPRGNLTGDPYFTDGRRILLWLSREQTAIDNIDVLGFLRPDAPPALPLSP
ncbi:LssY C-terminal domain-containing protein [Parahaliea maris]|uniref:LssY C-terminal domain-containing protein n=1 Tax=Parahaliea maris TaxID=2716870 RepID=UPI001F1D656D|nr:LssY C-terminal domain-containing protein [Parahaliea maris]